MQATDSVNKFPARPCRHQRHQADKGGSGPELIGPLTLGEGLCLDRLGKPKRNQYGRFEACLKEEDGNCLLTKGRVNKDEVKNNTV